MGNIIIMELASTIRKPVPTFPFFPTNLWSNHEDIFCEVSRILMNALGSPKRISIIKYIENKDYASADVALSLITGTNVDESNAEMINSRIIEIEKNKYGKYNNYGCCQYDQETGAHLSLFSNKFMEKP